MLTATHNLLIDVLSDLRQTTILWQLAVLAISLVLGWGINRLLLKRLPKPEGVSKVGLVGVYRVAFPLFALGLVLIGRAVLKSWYPVNLLNIVVPLLFALMLIRLVVYVLRQVFVPSGWLSGSELLIATTIWVVFALYVTGLLPDILDAMDYASFTVGGQQISLTDILGGILSVLVTLLAAFWLARVLERKVMAAGNLDMNLRVVLSKTIRASLIVVGVFIALSLAHIDITVLSLFGGALGVGIGFGLQRIASNYISGFIVLLDRSIHPGDMLTVDGRFGKVSKITARYLVLQSSDGTEAIIPNETLVSSTVINHTYSSRQVRIGIPVQISYQSDLHRAMEILKQAAANQPRVLTNPESKVFLKSFGENGIDLELGVWIDNIEEGQLDLRSDINMEILRRFRETGIEIPYPRREVRVIGGQPSV
ncbi:MAG TPA: mechanosensitive ion channel domain-containing protein [Burkholderiales bacterium]|nr:mechanosensitive ion channel domain-containing protein [Burkholderiales bacterium]